MFIATRVSDGKTYAYLAEAYRDGTSVKKKYIYNLGRVLDAEKGFYRNKERGVYTYDLVTNTFGMVPPDYKEPPRRKPTRYLNVSGEKRSLLCLEFGTTFFLDKVLQAMKLYPVIDSIDCANKDTLHALIFFYLLSKQANNHAQNWYELNYAKYLFPKATMASQESASAFIGLAWKIPKEIFSKPTTHTSKP